MAVDKYDRARSIIVMDSSKGVAKAVYVKINFSGFHPINRHVGNQISRFDLLVNEDIRMISFGEIDAVREGN